MEIFHRMANAVHGDTGTVCHCHSSHDIFIIVKSKKMLLMNVKNADRFAMVTKYDIIIFQTDTFRKAAPAGKIQYAGGRFFPKLPKYLIFIIEDHGIVLCLILCDHFLYPNILFHSMMTVQMIFCDI